MSGNSPGTNTRFSSFAEFYPYYLQEHADPRCRMLHYIGTAQSFVAFGLAVFVSPWWFLVGLTVGYACAWIGHFFIEKNKPATFTYPLWSFIGDYKMFFSWLTGKLPAQLDAAKTGE